MFGMFGFYSQLKQLIAMGVDASKAADVLAKKAKGDSGEDSKDVYVVFPPLERNDYPTTLHIPMINDAELREFVTIHRGNLMNKTGIKLRFNQLAQEGVYTIFGPSYMGIANDPRTSRVRNKMRELLSLLAVKNELSGFRELYLNVMVYGHVTNEILLHKDDPNIEHATAFICESSYEPTTDDINVLADKAVKFEAQMKSREAFSHVTKVVPVLSGHNWPNETLSRAQTAGMWTVRTSRNKYEVMRRFSTVARRLVKGK